MFGNLFKKPEVIFMGTLLQDIKVEEWADSMLCTTATASVKAGSIIKVYGYTNGKVSHIVVNSHKSLGKDYGLYTDIKLIVGKCRKMNIK